MGYSHDWYRPPVIPDNIYERIGADFERLVLPLEDMGILIAGPGGENEPEIDNDRIQFNGFAIAGIPTTRRLRFHILLRMQEALARVRPQSLDPGKT